MRQPNNGRAICEVSMGSNAASVRAQIISLCVFGPLGEFRPIATLLHCYGFIIQI